MFDKKLPHQRTIRKWYQSIDGDPGCTTEALMALKLKCADAARNKKKVICNLIMDEVAIRQHIEYDSTKKKFHGYVDFGNQFEDVSTEPVVAKEVLTFMVNALNDRWKIPVAYFLVNGLNSTEKSDIIKEVLIFLHSSDITISSITFDGAASNLASANKLQACLQRGSLNSTFLHPVTNQKIYIFLDICHMLKLIRNTFASIGVLYNKNGDSIQWSFVTKLEHLQSVEGVLLANKLRKKHVQFHNQKMKTSLAAQTISLSVAAALQNQINRKNKDFIGCEATIEFLTVFNNLFDVFNSKSKFGKRFKRPLRQDTFDEYNNYFEYAVDYIENLKILHNDVMKPILSTPSKTGYLGFLIAVSNFKGMYSDYVVPSKLEYILGYKLSQDHIETFFSAIRSRGGWNNNPTSQQFKAAYKKLLVHTEVKSATTSNCLDVGTPIILSVSPDSFGTPIKPMPVIDTGELLEDVASSDTESDVEIDIQYISPVIHDAVVYISGFVEKSLCKVLKKKCMYCKFEVERLPEYGQIDLINCKNFGGLIKPKTDIVEICLVAEKEVAKYNIEKKLHNDFYVEMLGKCFKKINMNIFSTFYEEISHTLECPHDRRYLVRYCLEKYIQIKLFHIAETKTIDVQKSKIRQKYNKLILFSGQ